MLPPRYEWCKFRHVPSGRVCDFEWNEAAYNITVLNCEDFAGRFVFLGKYNDYNCAVRIENARGEDARSTERAPGPSCLQRSLENP